MHEHGGHDHTHGSAVKLEPKAVAILQNGLQELLHLTEGMSFKPLPSEKYPHPLACAAYPTLPSPQALRADIQARLADPVSVLEKALALLELYECNQPDIVKYVQEDPPFLDTCFGSKRFNGWIAIMGDADHQEAASAINARWKFNFFSGPARPTGIYTMLSMLARYAYIYGRINSGDSHAMGHFIEDFCPGLILCHGRMSDLELTLSLAAMKMGVPAIVPADYPFPLGRTIRADSMNDIVEAVVGFANTRRLMVLPEVPQLPSYCDSANAEQAVSPDITWGSTADSFVIVRKGPVSAKGFGVKGKPAAGGGSTASSPPSGIGVVVTLDAEPMDAFDRAYIERTIVPKLATMKGVGFRSTDKEFCILQEKDTNLDPARIGEVLVAAIGNIFHKLKDKVFVEIIFDPATLKSTAPQVTSEKQARQLEIDSATEDNVEWFIGCTGCSSFAPDHVCIITPQRPPQCGRPIAMLKTGALYAYDEANMYHSRLQRDVNSFCIVARGQCIDQQRGEWSGVNAHAEKMTGGRTRRIFLHSLDEHPHTGCGCFNMVLFQMDTPRPGIGIMERGWQGRCPDGRSWIDLHYQLAGKQAPGVTGASAGYLKSAKFLRAHGGWASVVWVSPKIAAIMGDKLPAGIAIG